MYYPRTTQRERSRARRRRPGCCIATTGPSRYTFLSGPWTAGGTTYTAVETDESSDTVIATVIGGGWSYYELAIVGYEIFAGEAAGALADEMGIACGSGLGEERGQNYFS